MGAVLPAGVRVFGVRHHSPRSAAVLGALLRERQPSLLLVEAPPETEQVLEALTDASTEPPVAVLGYRTDGTPGSSLWPFASYSPELVAMSWARSAGAGVRCIDLPVGVVLAGASRASAEQKRTEAPPFDVHAAAAEARGLRSFEELWEATFEVPEHDEASFTGAISAYASLIREVSDRPYDRARDAWMAARIREAVEQGTDPERVVVVCGAAHAAAFASGEVDASAADALPAPVPSQTTLIPFSFPRLSEQLGYGAGNRAPQYYQRAHDAGCDFRRATLEVLADFTGRLRARGFSVSLADTIEAYRLAGALAGLRQKAAPGLDEVREAAISVLCRGEAAHVDRILWPAVVGRRVGRVSQRIGSNSLQEEFWREVDHRRLPRADEPERFNLQLNSELHVGTSVFLHRLRICDVPYATFQGTRTVSGFRSAEEEAGGLAALTRVRETWLAQWTPATEVALVEAIVLGNTIEQVTVRRLDERLASADTTGEAADVLLESTVTDCTAVIEPALARCDRLASTDDELASLARATRALSGLTSYGSSRARAGAAIEELCAKIFDRAVLRIGHAVGVDDDAIAGVLGALRALHDVALAQPKVDGDAWFAAARALVDDYAAHPAASGLCCGLLFIAQEIDDAGVVAVMRQRLSDPGDPGRVARFLEGFLGVDATVLTRSDPVIEAVDGFLLGLEPEAFCAVLPVLRRAFEQLGTTERRYLHETLMRVRGVGTRAAAREARAVLDGQQDERQLALEVDQDLSAALDDLEDLF